MKNKELTPEEERKRFMAYLEDSVKNKFECYGAEHPITKDFVEELEKEKAKDAAASLLTDKTAEEKPL